MIEPTKTLRRIEEALVLTTRAKNERAAKKPIAESINGIAGIKLGVDALYQAEGASDVADVVDLVHARLLLARSQYSTIVANQRA